MKEGEFHVNTDHPYYSVSAKRAGQSRAAREFLRTFDLFAIAERLLEGHLLDIGIPEREVAEVVGWREGLFRQLASSYDKTPEIIAEMSRTSYVGSREFEKALHNVFEDMGFAAEHDGQSGQKDILVVATVGPESYKFIVEAKGSKNEVDNEAAKIAAAANHRDQVGVDHAVVVARKFAGFGPDRDSDTAALYKECYSTQGVSIMEIEALEEVHQAITRFSYPLPLLRDIFTTLETPAQKLVRIRGLTEPAEGFDYSDLLNKIWEKQGGTASDDVVPYLSVFQEGRWKGEGMAFQDFKRRLVALDTLAAGRISMTSKDNIYLRQSPDLILAQIEKSLRGEGHDFRESEG